MRRLSKWFHILLSTALVLVYLYYTGNFLIETLTSKSAPLLGPNLLVFCWLLFVIGACIQTTIDQWMSLSANRTPVVLTTNIFFAVVFFGLALDNYYGWRAVTSLTLVAVHLELARFALTRLRKNKALKFDLMPIGRAFSLFLSTAYLCMIILLLVDEMSLANGQIRPLGLAQAPIFCAAASCALTYFYLQRGTAPKSAAYILIALQLVVFCWLALNLPKLSQVTISALVISAAAFHVIASWSLYKLAWSKSEPT